jgi:hypothetical protein
VSTCISSHGEYSSHTLDSLHTCTLCYVLDEDALRAELEQLRADLTKSNEEHERHYEAACQLSADLRGAQLALTEAEVDRLKVEQRADRFESERDAARNDVGLLDRERVEASQRAERAEAVVNLAREFRQAVAAWDVVRDANTPVGALIAGVDAYDEMNKSSVNAEVGTQTAHDDELSTLELGTLSASDIASVAIAGGGGFKSAHVELSDDLDADLADINRRAAADQRVLDAAKVWREDIRAIELCSPEDRELALAVDMRDALADPEIAITQPVPPNATAGGEVRAKRWLEARKAAGFCAQCGAHLAGEHFDSCPVADPAIARPLATGGIVDSSKLYRVGEDTPHTVLPDDYPPCPNTHEGQPCIFPKHSDEQVCRFLTAPEVTS